MSRITLLVFITALASCAASNKIVEETKPLTYAGLKKHCDPVAKQIVNLDGLEYLVVLTKKCLGYETLVIVVWITKQSDSKEQRMRFAPMALKEFLKFHRYFTKEWYLAKLINYDEAAENGIKANTAFYRLKLKEK